MVFGLFKSAKTKAKERIDKIMLVLPGKLAACEVLYSKVNEDKIVDKTTRKISKKKVYDYARESHGKIFKASKKYREDLESFISNPRPKLLEVENVFKFSNCFEKAEVMEAQELTEEFVALVKRFGPFK